MYKCAVWLVLVAIVVPAVMACSSPLQSAPDGAEVLARRVPAGWGQVLYMDTKPTGGLGQRWAAVRSRLETEPSAVTALLGLQQPFQLENYNLQDVAVGPAMQVTSPGGECLIVQVGEDAAALAAAREVLPTRSEDTVDGHTVFYGPYGQGRMAWTVGDWLFRSCIAYGSDPRSSLRQMLALPESQSVAAQPTWQALRRRLPEELLGLAYVDMEAAGLAGAGASGDKPPELFARQFKAVAVAVLPEEQGIRLKIAGQVALEDSAGPQTRALFNSSGTEPATWEHLPAGTGLALLGRDASLWWPLFAQTLDLNALTAPAQLLGLDLEADLIVPDGPLAGEFALALLPPLPDQPISQGVPAGQMLMLGRGAGQAQAAQLQAAMEGRGAAFGPGEAEGVPLQVQAGTQASGYALSVGLDGDVLLVGSSPQVAGQAATAARDRQGLVHSAAFRTVSAAWPERVWFAVYIDAAQFAALLEANTTAEDYTGAGYTLLSVYRALGMGLWLDEQWLGGEALLLLR